MSRDSSRKPSGSSTQSAAHSPTTPPGNSHSSLRITPTTTGNMLSVGVGAPSGRMSYNSGWQVWGSDSPSSQRNPSISSAASAGDLPPPSQSDSGYRGAIREGWTSSRPTSGTWDEDVTQSPQSKEFQEPSASLNLHPSRQRQSSATSFSAPRADNRSAKYAPQSYDNGSRYNTAPSPSMPLTSPPYSVSHPPTQPPGLTGASGYDTISNTVAVDDLSLNFRGMAVEDDYGGRPRLQAPLQMPTHQLQQPPLPVNQQISQPRGPYASYSGYYGASGESQPDYSYYGAPGDPSAYGSSAPGHAGPANMFLAPQGLLPPSVNDIHRQQSLFYDFNSSRTPPSQYYYPTPGIIFPPASSPIAASQIPPMLASLDKKREFSQYNVNLPQQLLAHALMYGPRSTSSQHGYAPTMDYPRVPLMMPGAPFNVSPQMFAPVTTHQTQPALRSAILEEFRSNKTRNWELRDIMGHIVEFSGDQHGSRFIQQKLETASSDEKQRVFDEIVPNSIHQLTIDVFGNYVVQKLLEHGTQLQKSRLAAEMEGQVFALSKQMYGCRVVQKAIECILPDQQASFVRELEPHIMNCVQDANGNHVIQKLIECVSPDRLGFVYTFRGNVQELATHSYGCRVLQRALEHLPEEMTAPLTEELHSHTVSLMQNQFGNYVMQFMIEHGRPHDRNLIVARLRGQLLAMARHKFASNVCEKALTYAEPEMRRILIEEIISPKYESLTPVTSMMKDQFANYVLQRAVAVADADQRENLINQIRPQLAIMRRFSNAYSKHLISIERLLQQYAPPQPAALPPVP